MTRAVLLALLCASFAAWFYADRNPAALGMSIFCGFGALFAALEAVHERPTP